MRSFLPDVAGSTAAMFALSLPAMLGGVGVAVDFGMFNMKVSKLQAAADQAALAGAKELALVTASQEAVQASADSYARSIIGDSKSDLTIEATINQKDKSVKVAITERWSPFFAHFLGADVTPVKVDATAGLFGESKICVLALSPGEAGAVWMTKNARMEAATCSVYSNSDNSNGISMSDTSSILANLVCSVGGVKDNGSLTASSIVTDCPVIADPLATRVPPKVGACDFNKVAFTSGTHSLAPGVYCGGLQITGTAKVTLQPGEYIIKDGPLWVYDTAELVGTNVGFFLTGAKGLLHFRGDATIDLSGRESGTMAGMLIFDDPAMKSLLRVHTVSARNATNLTGTIYMPNANFIVNPTATVGENSAYTAIVAKRLMVENGPTLVLNTNYEDTPVPVPDGIRLSTDVHLID